MTCSLIFPAAEFGPVTVSVVDKYDSVVTINDTALTIGGSVTFHYVVNTIDDLEGNVTVTVNGNPTKTISSIAAGTYEVVVTFTGNATHKAASASKTFRAEKQNVTIVIGVNTLEIGAEATFTAQIVKNK